jgi:molecular chaperone DnaK (HSP70)
MLSRVAGRVQGGGGLRAGLSGADVWASADEEDEEGGGLLPPSPSSSAHATAGGGAAALRLRGAAEAAKVTLSSSDQAAVELRLVPGGPVARVALSRARFDQLTAPLVARVVGLVTAAAAEAGVALEGGGGDKASPPPPSSPGGGDKYAPPPRRITHAILVGGGARVPAVRAAIAGVVGVEPVATIDPEACVALGAAAIAAALAGDASAGGGFELADGPYAPHLHGRASGFGVE